MLLIVPPAGSVSSGPVLGLHESHVESQSIVKKVGWFLLPKVPELNIQSRPGSFGRIYD